MSLLEYNTYSVGHLSVLGSPCGSSNASSVCNVAHSGCSTAEKCSCNANYVEESTKCLKG